MGAGPPVARELAAGRVGAGAAGADCGTRGPCSLGSVERFALFHVYGGYQQQRRGGRWQQLTLLIVLMSSFTER